MRKTKIVATIGPACDSKDGVRAMIEAGVDVFRFNMKHNTTAWHGERMELLESVCSELGVRVGMMLDLQGPEVRIDGLDEPMTINPGDKLKFNAPGKGGMCLDHPQIFGVLKAGQTIFADDGFLEFRVVEVASDGIVVEVVEGGVLKSRKTVNFPGMHLDFAALVEKDLEHLSLAGRHHVDFVALSFVRSADDVRLLRSELKRFKIESKIISKIEHPDAVEKFDEVLAESDGIMVARGDLGIEYPMEEVPGLQKMIVAKCREEGKPVIVATQMLESMITNIRPTRAEVSDVANAVYDSADAVMLSGESASGKYPIRAVKIMAKILAKVDESAIAIPTTTDCMSGGQTAAVVAAGNMLAQAKFAEEESLKAFVVFSESGRTAELLSRLRPKLPVVVVSSNRKTVDQLKLSWGVKPVWLEYKKKGGVDENQVLAELVKIGLIEGGVKVIMVHGEEWGVAGSTNVVKIKQVS